MTMRLSASSLAGTARTLVAVGTVSEAFMFLTTLAAAPRSGICLAPAAGAFAAGLAAGLAGGLGGRLGGRLGGTALARLRGGRRLRLLRLRLPRLGLLRLLRLRLGPLRLR